MKDIEQFFCVLNWMKFVFQRKIALLFLWGNDAHDWNVGHVRIFQYSNEQQDWSQLGEDIDGEARADYFGTSVSLNAEGNIFAIGGPQNDGNGQNSGHVRVFIEQNGSWIQLGADILGEAELNHAGISVSLNNEGTIVALGAYRNDEVAHVSCFEYFKFLGRWQNIKT